LSAPLADLPGDLLASVSEFLPWNSAFAFLRSSKRVRNVLFFSNVFYRALAAGSGMRTGGPGRNFKTALVRRARDRVSRKRAARRQALEEDLARTTLALNGWERRLASFESKHRAPLFEGTAGIPRLGLAKMTYDFAAGEWVTLENPFAVYSREVTAMRSKVEAAREVVATARGELEPA
jgi:hypothetical protein